MTDGFVEKKIQHSNLAILLTGIIGLVAIVAVAFFARGYYDNYFNGPFKADNKEIASLSSLSGVTEYYVTVLGDDAYETGYEKVSVDDDGVETTVAYFMALLVEDRLLLVRTVNNKLEMTYTGELRDLNDAEYENIILALESEIPEIKGAFLPVMLDTQNFKNRGNLGFVFGGLGLGIVFLCLLLGGIRQANPNRHPVMKDIQRFGAVEFMVGRINMEMASAHETIRHTHLLHSWLVQEVGLTFKITRYEDIVWIYKQVTQHRSYGIPTGKTYMAMIYDRFGKGITVSGNEKSVDEILQKVAEKSPQAFKGYRQDVALLWRKDRQAFISMATKKKFFAD